jgi:hypothetical protein
MSTQTQGGDSDLSPSIQQKVSRIQELRAEADRLTKEAEQEYFTPERLERFDQRYRRLSFADALVLTTRTHENYDIEFDRCLGYCKKNQLYSFAPQSAEVRQPPMPVDSPLGPAPIPDWDSRKAAADRIRDQHPERACEVHPEPPPDDRGTPMAERLEEVAAATAEFESRICEAKAITAELSTRDSRNEARQRPVITETGRDEIIARITAQNAELEKRRTEAERIRNSKLRESELARQKFETPARPKE